MTEIDLFDGVVVPIFESVAVIQCTILKLDTHDIHSKCECKWPQIFVFSFTIELR